MMSWVIEKTTAYYNINPINENIPEVDEDVTTSDTLPEGIKTVFIHSHDTNLSFDLFPSSVEHLHFSYTPIRKLPDQFPKGLRTLVLSSTKVKTLPDILPEILEELDISYSKISWIPDLPTVGLKKLYCRGSKIKYLPETLPMTLQLLDCKNSKLKKLPEELPMGLKELNIAGTRVKNLNMVTLPDHLVKLDISFMGQVHQLPYLPPYLQTLICNDTSIKYLPNEMPSGLKELDFRFTNVVTFKKMSTSLVLTPNFDRKVKWCHPSNCEQLRVNKTIMTKKIKTHYVAGKYLYRNKAAKIIQQNLKNWLYKDVCADGTLGIRARLSAPKVEGYECMYPEDLL